MRIIWGNLSEVKKFIDMVDLDKLCKDEKEWGGVGVIITGRDIRKDGRSPSKESYTLHQSDYIIVTPCYKELSWLFRNTYRDVEGCGLEGVHYIQGFWAASTGFFLQHPKYKAKELLLFVVDFLEGVEKRERDQCADSACSFLCSLPRHRNVPERGMEYPVIKAALMFAG